MMNVSDALYEAVLNRDPVFDGRYFIGIVTTGIVCFPSCRSRIPNRENIRVFQSMEDALLDGFRPCKRCRPDHPTGRSPDAEIVQCVQHILSAHYEEPITLLDLAETMHLSPSHLQRTVKRYTGLSPQQHLQQIRIMRAQQFLADTTLAISEVAHRVGFRSASHFRATFKHFMGVSPGTYRKHCQQEVTS